MDYDDNEFQGQNLHLAVEGSSNFSPVLRPYVLPKFDFDDSLQGSLKFDSLVENEVFLGIPSQEDNQWIEDFSRASSGIEFSSTAVESCSISRRNVWSEATSSESVEMLLKSVGQEEMVPGETIIEESDTCDELGSLDKQMEPNLKEDDRREDATDSQPAVPPDVENFSELIENAECERPIFKCPLQTQEAEQSAYGSLNELDPNVVSEKYGLFVREDLGIDRNCGDATERIVDASITTSLNYLMEENASMPTNSVDFFSENVVACTAELSNQEIPPQVSATTSESTKDLLTEPNKGVEKDGAPSKAVNKDDQILRGTAVGSSTYILDSPLSVASKVESVEEHVVEASITNFEGSSSSVPKGSDDLKTAEKDCNEGVCSTNPGEGSMCEINILSEVGVPEAAMLPEVENEPFRQGGGGSTSSGKLLKGNSEVENLEGGDGVSGVHQKDSNCLDSDLSPILAASIQMCKATTLSEPDDASNSVKGVTSHGNKNGKLPSETSHVEGAIVGSLDVDKTVGSLLVGECIKEKVVIANGSEIDNTSGNRPALEDNHIATHDILDGIPSLSGNVTSAGEVIDHNKAQESPVIVELTHVDKKEEIVVGVPTKVSISTSKECSQVERELGSVFKAEKGKSHDCATPMLNEVVDQSVSIVEACNMEDHSEQAVVAKEVNEECSENPDAYPVPRESIIEAGAGPEAESLENHTEMKVKDHEVEPLKVSADSSADHQASFGLACSSEFDANCMLEGGGSAAESDKPSCDSPTVFSCIGISQNEKDKQDVLKGAGNASPSEVAEKAQTISLNPRESDASREERSFTFEVSPAVHLSEGETGKAWQSFPTLQACKISMIVEGSPSTSGAEQVNPTMVQEISRASPQARRGGAKSTAERKTRRASGKASAKENSKKGIAVNETALVRQLDRGNKSSSVPMSSSGSGQVVQFEELKPYGNVDCSGTKPSVVISIPTSNLPDLNTSAPLSALSQQPFTDLQQVQLRAQIFVYGSLIVGAAPDEACMISAFGPSDGGRSFWEPAWHTSVERLRGQKSLANNSETPVQSHSGARVPDQSAKQSSLQNKAFSSSVGRASSKGTPSHVVSPMIPLSSPLWNISTSSCDGLQSSGMQRGPHFDYHQTLSPLHPFQTPPIRNLAGHNISWLSQAPFPGPWVTSPQTSAYDFNSRFSALPYKETVNLTPVNESSVPVSSGIKHVPPIPVSQGGNPSVLIGTPAPLDVKKVTASPGHHTADPKTRKRKKVSVSENPCQISVFAQTRSESFSTPVVGSYLPKTVPACEAIGQISLIAETRTESVCAPFVSGHFSTAVAVTAPSSFASKSSSDKFVTAVSPPSYTDRKKQRDQNIEKKVITPEEAFAKVEEAKLQAEDAAAHAAAAVSQCEDVWSELDKQKNSGLISDVEAKLASAAVAIAAAASVAKAAAAAAQLASNAAAQAKLMADEALVPSGTGNPALSNAISELDVVRNYGKATPISILKGGDGSNSSTSIIAAAREASRRRVEAASIASRHAENLDAIIKAAELAAAAVSQSGTIVAMGDPLPLRLLVEAGPEGYWKVPHVSFESAVKSNNANRDQANNANIVEESPIVSAKQSQEGPLNQETQTKNHGMPPLPKEVSRDLKKNNASVVEGILGSVTSSQKDSRGKRGNRASDLAKTIGAVPESDSRLGSASFTVQDEYENMVLTFKDNSIKEGYLVEVFKDAGHAKAAWFPANVLSLKDGKAFVSYTKLESDEGLGQLKEWVPLEGEATKSPRIRIPHPVTSVRVEGTTKKRRRAAFTDYTWSVGDRVDALMEDCWREGVVTENNEKDETKLTVHFPAEGETSVVRVWLLRPTLIWKDGKWIECSTFREKDSSVQGDTRQDKRLKLGSPVIEGEAKNTILENIGLVESKKHQESSLLPLAASEKIFDVGKDTREENNKPGAPRTIRSGLQKEGSRVIFGVPKPGKKRKFMEVSKHYVGDRSGKNNLASDSVKLANFLMPQRSGSRGWRNNSKIDAKEKQAAESRPRVLQSGKPPIVSGRTLPQKDKFLATQVSAPNDATKTDALVRDAIRNEENNSGQQNIREFGSFSNTEATEGPILFSSLALPADAPSKKVSASNAKSVRQNKGKLAPAGGKPSKIEVKDKSIPEVAEPRRSNRRIQPTSRLLEGLQSSMTISKIPAASHDRSHKIPSRGPSRGNSHD